MATERAADDSERVVRIVVYPDVQALDAVGPHEVFAGATQWLAHQRPDAPRYRLELVGADPCPCPTESGLLLSVSHTLAQADPRLAIDTLVVAGGTGCYRAQHDPALIDWIRTQAAHARRVTSVCTGAFLLAAAGLLDHRRATTHWDHAARLAATYPLVEVDPDPIFVRDDPVWTSAGVTAGIDLTLALVEDDLGPPAAQAIARRLVMFLRRPGGQSQFATGVWADRPRQSPIADVCDLIVADPGADLTVPALAAHANLSERHFLRRFRSEVGCSPSRYVERLRVEAARRLLETSDDNVGEIAHRCGFGTAETMRRTFVRHLGVPPAAYRDRFSLRPPVPLD